MKVSDEDLGADPTLVTSIWRHRWLVLGCALASALIGLGLASTREVPYTSSAGVLLQDPRTLLLDSKPNAGEERRYVADQVAIMRSAAVSERAAAIASAASMDFTPAALRSAASVVTNEEANFVEVRVTASSPERAQVGANSIVTAYREFVREGLDDAAKEASQRLDNAIADVTSSIAKLGQGGATAPAQDQIAAIASELQELRGSSAAPETISSEADRLSSELRAWLTVAEADPDAGSLELRRSLDLLDQLQTEQNRLEAQAKVVSDGVAIFSPAAPGKGGGVSSKSVLVISLFLGTVLGTGLAYWLDSRRRTFSDELQPQRVVGAPILAEVPTLGRSTRVLPLPVLTAEGSTAAETFSLLAFDVATALGLSGTASGRALEGLFGAPRREGQNGASPGTRPSQSSDAKVPGSHRSIAIVSATQGQGATMVAANTALAAAQQGRNVLLIDADIPGGHLSSALIDSGGDLNGGDPSSTTPGLAELLRTRSSTRGPLHVMSDRSGGSLSLLPPGMATSDAMSLFRPERFAEVLDDLGARFDLIVVDVPPVLEVAYASALLRGTGVALVVVRHHSPITLLHDVRGRLDRSGARTIGYVYSSAPRMWDASTQRVPAGSAR